MKKLFLAALLAFAAPAFGATAILSTGAACEYSAITLAANGTVTVVCANAPAPPPVVTPPAPPAPPPIAVSYPGHDMWQYDYRRLSTGNLAQGQKATGGFTVPSGNAGQTVEFGISGANLTIYVDGKNYTGPFTATTGNHLIEAQAVNQSANGSIDVYHY